MTAVCPTAPCTVAPGHYFLIQEGTATGALGASLPTPDANGNIAMAVGSGKVAVLNNTTALRGVCPTSAALVDLVGYGSANCSEISPAATLNGTHAALRNGAGCIDTGNNSNDFAAGQPNARNSSTPAHECGSSSQPGVLSNDRREATLDDSKTEAGASFFKIESGASLSNLEWPLPLLFVSDFPDCFSISDKRDCFSERHRRWDSKRSRTDASASDPRETRGGPPRPRGASP